MGSESAEKMCVDAANLKVRSVRERLFPPTWVKALTLIKAAHSDPTPFSPTPRDLLDELLLPIPHGGNEDDPERDFRTWFYYHHEFGKLLRLYEAMSRVAVGLNLCDPSEPEFAAWFEIAARLLDCSGDRDIAIVCLEVAASETA
jgi:hypothetical protein